MNVSNIITNTNTFIGDSSTDRVSATDRYQAVTEATAWLLEELGNEHMTDRAEIEFLPTVTWYKMDNLTPYLLTAGQLRFKEAQSDLVDFTRVEARELENISKDRHAYAIERYNDDSYLGIVMPEKHDLTHKDLVPLDESDSLTYTGTNATAIFKEKNAIRFDMTNTGVTSTGLTTTTESVDITDYEGTGIIIVELEIPDMEDITTVTIKFGTDTTSNYWLGTVSQDVNGNPLAVGVNTLKFKWADLTKVGTPSISAIVTWQWLVNHLSSKPVAEGFKLSDMRIAKPTYLNFKYLFFRVGKSSAGADIIEFTADTDEPFFSERYPQYRYAVAHKAAGILFRSLQQIENARAEDREANNSLDRYRKNFSGERDMGSSNFKVAGVSLRGKRIIKRR